jgi:hypothetical protein
MTIGMSIRSARTMRRTTLSFASQIFVWFHVNIQHRRLPVVFFHVVIQPCVKLRNYTAQPIPGWNCDQIGPHILRLYVFAHKMDVKGVQRILICVCWSTIFCTSMNPTICLTSLILRYGDAAVDSVCVCVRVYARARDSAIFRLHNLFSCINFFTGWIALLGWCVYRFCERLFLLCLHLVNSVLWSPVLSEVFVSEGVAVWRIGAPSNCFHVCVVSQGQKTWMQHKRRLWPAV